MTFIKTPVIRNGYAQWVYPFTLRQGELYLMLGDHGKFCPVQFEVRHDAI